MFVHDLGITYPSKILFETLAKTEAQKIQKWILPVKYTHSTTQTTFFRKAAFYQISLTTLSLKKMQDKRFTIKELENPFKEAEKG